MTPSERIAALESALRGLMEIAEIAMPDTYFQSDSRVQAAQRLLQQSTPPTSQHIHGAKVVNIDHASTVNITL